MFHNYSSEIIMLLVLASITLEQSFLQQTSSSIPQYISSTVYFSNCLDQFYTGGWGSLSAFCLCLSNKYMTLSLRFLFRLLYKGLAFHWWSNGFSQLHRCARSNEMLYNDVKIKAHHNL